MILIKLIFQYLSHYELNVAFALVRATGHFIALASLIPGRGRGRGGRGGVGIALSSRSSRVRGRGRGRGRGVFPVDPLELCLP